MTYIKKVQRNEYQRIWVAERRKRGIEVLGGQCVECGTTENLEFDHIDHNEKVTHRSWSWTRILEELAKCQLLCHDDHLAKTRQFDTRWKRKVANG